MTRRYQSLEEALAALDAAAPSSDCRIVVSWAWWDALSEAERDTYRTRCGALRGRLIVDHRISRHFVEVSAANEPPLSSEHGA